MKMFRTAAGALVAVATLALSGVANAGTATITPYLTPQVVAPVQTTLGGCAADDTDLMQITWSASTTADIELTPAVQVIGGFVDEVIRMNLQVAGQPLLDVRGFQTFLANYPPPPAAICPQCSKLTGPVNQAAATTFSAPGVQAVYGNAFQVSAGNPIFEALKGGGNVLVRLDAQGDSNVRNWGPNVLGGVNTFSQASVTCAVIPQREPPDSVPAISLLGLLLSLTALPALGVALMRKRG
jgi:hypothetical protein